MRKVLRKIETYLNYNFKSITFEMRRRAISTYLRCKFICHFAVSPGRSWLAIIEYTLSFGFLFLKRWLSFFFFFKFSQQYNFPLNVLSLFISSPAVSNNYLAMSQKFYSFTLKKLLSYHEFMILQRTFYILASSMWS